MDNHGYFQLVSYGINKLQPNNKYVRINQEVYLRLCIFVLLLQKIIVVNNFSESNMNGLWVFSMS